MPHKRRWPLLLLLPLIALASAACGAGVVAPASTPSATPTLPSNTAVAEQWQLHPGAQVPDMTVSLYQGAEELGGGQQVQLSQVLALGKPVILNFWAALCPPCRQEMPEFQRVQQAHGQDVVLLGVDIGPQLNMGTTDQGRALLQQLGITYPVGTTSDQNVPMDFRLLGMPTTFFIRSDGRLLKTWNGLVPEDKLNGLVGQLLQG